MDLKLFSFFFKLFDKQHCSVPKILFISRLAQGRARNLIKTIEVQKFLGLIQLLGSMNYYIKNVLIIYVNSTPAKFSQYLPKTQVNCAWSIVEGFCQ